MISEAATIRIEEFFKKHGAALPSLMPDIRAMAERACYPEIEQAMHGIADLLETLQEEVETEKTEIGNKANPEAKAEVLQKILRSLFENFTKANFLELSEQDDLVKDMVFNSDLTIIEFITRTDLKDLKEFFIGSYAAYSAEDLTGVIEWAAEALNVPVPTLTWVLCPEKGSEGLYPTQWALYPEKDVPAGIDPKSMYEVLMPVNGVHDLYNLAMFDGAQDEDDPWKYFNEETNANCFVFISPEWSVLRYDDNCIGYPTQEIPHTFKEIHDKMISEIKKKASAM